MRKFGQWEALNVLGTGVLFAAVPATTVASYHLSLRGSCGGRWQPECDGRTSVLVIFSVVTGFLVMSLGQWILMYYRVFSGRRIPAAQLVGTYISVFGVALCVGIIVTRESLSPQLIFAVVAAMILALEVFRLSRLPGWKHFNSLLRAANVPLSDKRQERAQPWTGPFSCFEIAHYVAMALGAFVGLLSAAIL
ncbi:hypothetical protein ACWHLZ_45520 [Streptomyces chartreusis]